MFFVLFKIKSVFLRFILLFLFKRVNFKGCIKLFVLIFFFLMILCMVFFSAFLLLKLVVFNFNLNFFNKGIMSVWLSFFKIFFLYFIGVVKTLFILRVNFFKVWDFFLRVFNKWFNWVGFKWERLLKLKGFKSFNNFCVFWFFK